MEKVVSVVRNFGFIVVVVVYKHEVWLKYVESILYKSSEQRRIIGGKRRIASEQACIVQLCDERSTVSQWRTRSDSIRRSKR
jgi:2-C-methyl-D-erythritol 4-phosphate cytidylyltransferase